LIYGSSLQPKTVNKFQPEEGLINTKQNHEIKTYAHASSLTVVLKSAFVVVSTETAITR